MKVHTATFFTEELIFPCKRFLWNTFLKKTIRHFERYVIQTFIRGGFVAVINDP